MHMYFNMQDINTFLFVLYHSNSSTNAYMLIYRLKDTTRNASKYTFHYSQVDCVFNDISEVIESSHFYKI